MRTPIGVPPRLVRLFSGLLACLLLLSVACSGEEPAPTVTPLPTITPSPRPSPTPTAVPTATPRPRPEASEFPEDLRQQARQLLDRVAAVRNSPPMREVDMFLLSRELVRAYYSGGSSPPPPADATPAPAPSNPPEPRVDLKQETYVLLGLVPPPERAGGRDLEQQQLDNLIPIITGFYSNEYTAFYLVETINGGIYGGLARSTIVHELVHALQYQYLDIDAVARQRAGDWDSMTALLSVIEGDAVHTENMVLGFSTRSTYRQPVCFTIPAPIRPGTPFVIERELDVWYEDGMCFIQAVAPRVLRGIAGILEDLPTTMEQVLHPEKYLAGEPAKPVVLRAAQDALGSSWRELGRANFGEFGLQNLLLLGLLSDRPAVQSAAAGWGGDAFVLYGNGDNRLLYAETVWDAPQEAQEFFDTLAKSMANRAGSVAPAGADRYGVDLDGVRWRAFLTGPRVTLIVSTDPHAADSVAAVVEKA